MRTADIGNYLRLVRPPNLFTAVSNVAAGHVIASGGNVRWPALALAAAGSVALYAGGVALNDFADRSEDAVHRPERPIPSGKVRAKAALALSLGLLAAGGTSGFFLSLRAGMFSASVLVSILAYDLILKRTPAAPFSMAACRALNWLFAIASGGALFPAAAAGPAAVFLYVALLTSVSRGEETRPALRRLVGAGVLAIPVLDGSIAAAFGYPAAGGAIALLAVPAVLAARISRPS